jgi:hypothetical protein
MDNLLIAEKLDEARKLIEARGWCRNNYTCGGKVCALGAINAVTSGNPTLEFRTPWSAMTCALADAIGASGTSEIPTWNDAPERTQAEVIEAFRKASQLSRNSQQPTTQRGPGE